MVDENNIWDLLPATDMVTQDEDEANQRREELEIAEVAETPVIEEVESDADVLLNELWDNLDKNETEIIEDEEIIPENEEAKLKTFTPRKMVNGKLVSDIAEAPGINIPTPKKPVIGSPQWWEDLPTLKEVTKEIKEVINIYKGEDNYTKTKTNLVNDLGEAITGTTYENLPPGNKLELLKMAEKKLEEEYMNMKEKRELLMKLLQRK